MIGPPKILLSFYENFIFLESSLVFTQLHFTSKIMPVTTRSNGYYAVRNGTMTGVYDQWYKAVQAGFRQQEGYGNAKLGS